MRFASRLKPYYLSNIGIVLKTTTLLPYLNWDKTPFKTADIQIVVKSGIEKYMTGIVTNNACKLYSIYANQEQTLLWK